MHMKLCFTNEITENVPILHKLYNIAQPGTDFITARKRSLRRLCFHRCLSTGWGSTWAGTPQAGTPPGRDSPRQVPPHLAGTLPPGQVHPLGRYTPSRAGTPLATVHSGVRSTSGRYASHWNAFFVPVVIVHS